MKEIVVISGKGGTGKTTLTASFAHLAAPRAVVADCDVDAADLFLLLQPTTRNRETFRSGHQAHVVDQECVRCGACVSYCRFGAIQVAGPNDGEGRIWIDASACEGCGVCVRFCPLGVIAFPEATCGEWYVSDTRFGELVHARLKAGAENSGKLVTLVRTEARRRAEESGKDVLLVDGAPGIGCPVIASLTSADGALIVTEPTVAGEHDFSRIAQLTTRLGVPSAVCINKHDINTEKTAEITRLAADLNVRFGGVISYDPKVTEAQMAGACITEFDTGRVSDEVRSLWNEVNKLVHTQ